jgi:hypothetical protein
MTYAQFERYAQHVQKTKDRFPSIGGTGVSLILYTKPERVYLFWDGTTIRIKLHNLRSRQNRILEDTGMKAIHEFERRAGRNFTDEIGVELVLP